MPGRRSEILCVTLLESLTTAPCGNTIRLVVSSRKFSKCSVTPRTTAATLDPWMRTGISIPTASRAGDAVGEAVAVVSGDAD